MKFLKLEDKMLEYRYVDIPGNKLHELPPLLVHSAAEGAGDITTIMGEAEDMLSSSDVEESVLEQRKYDLALQLTEQYKHLLSHWLWGDSVLEWIRQCEITFEAEEVLRTLLHPDVWPHASRSSFVRLLGDKHVPTQGVKIEKAVGLRLAFRQPPPIDCFSSQFLFYLNSTVAGSAYQAWANLVPPPVSALPPERFHFDVVDIGE